MALIFENNASSQLASAFGDGDTTLIVKSNDGALFPTLSNNDVFRVTLENDDGELEVCQIIGRVNDTLTVGAFDGNGDVIESTDGRNIESVPQLNSIWAVDDRVEIRLTAASINQIQEAAATSLQAAAGILGDATGTAAANDYIVTLDPAVTSLTDGLRVYFTIPATMGNDGPSTLTVDSEIAKAIVYYDGAALDAGALLPGTTTGVIYNAALDKFILKTGGIAASMVGNGGHGTGLDADLLDSVEGSDYARISIANVFEGLNEFEQTLTADNNITINNPDDLGSQGITWVNSSGETIGYISRNMETPFNLSLVAKDATAGTTGAYLYLSPNGPLTMGTTKDGDIFITANGSGDINAAVSTGRFNYKGLEVATISATQTIGVTGSYTYPEGLIMKWGVIDDWAATGSHSFASAFPTACYNVQLTMRSDAGGVLSLTESIVNLPTASGFSWKKSGTARFLHWTALGK